MLIITPEMPAFNFKTWLVSIPGVIWGELAIRLVLLGAFIALELVAIPPFERKIQPEEAWLYKFPTTTAEIVSSQALLWLMIGSCVAIFLIAFGSTRKLKPALVALLVPTLAIPLTGIFTNIIKITVGRPRPDFYNRCYGRGYLAIKDLTKPCTGDSRKVMGGRKSFPSGHSSLTFCALGFISVYLASQLRTFVIKGSSWRLLLTLLPLVAATLVAISRTMDYRHHWQDVVVGGILGLSVMYTIHLQYFPGLSSINCQTPYPIGSGSEPEPGPPNNSDNSVASTSTADSDGTPTAPGTPRQWA